MFRSDSKVGRLGRSGRLYHQQLKGEPVTDWSSEFFVLFELLALFEITGYLCSSLSLIARGSRRSFCRISASALGERLFVSLAPPGRPSVSTVTDCNSRPAIDQSLGRQVTLDVDRSPVKNHHQNLKKPTSAFAHLAQRRQCVMHDTHSAIPSQAKRSTFAGGFLQLRLLNRLCVYFHSLLSRIDC